MEIDDIEIGACYRLSKESDALDGIKVRAVAFDDRRTFRRVIIQLEAKVPDEEVVLILGQIFRHEEGRYSVNPSTLDPLCALEQLADIAE